MLCNECNDDIFEEDILKCNLCNEFYHFMCVGLKESTFRRMSKNAKLKWFCKCKSNDIKKSPNQVFTSKNEKNSSDEKLLNLTVNDIIQV